MCPELWSVRLFYYYIICMKKVFLLLFFIASIAYSQDTLRAEYPTVRVILPDNEPPLIDRSWFTTLIGAVIGAGLSIAVWFIQEGIQSRRRRKDKQEDDIEDLIKYKAEASSLIASIYQNAVETLTNQGIYSAAGKTLSAPREKPEQLYHQYLQHYLSNMTEFRRRLEYFESIMRENFGWNALMNELNSFNVNLSDRMDEKDTFNSAPIIAAALREANDYRTLLYRIDTYLDKFIRVVQDYGLEEVNLHIRDYDLLNGQREADLIFAVRAYIVERDRYKFWKRKLFELT
jgi:hypothetical protein